MITYLISDNVDSFLGLKISGIKGFVVHEKKEVLDLISNIKNNKEVGIIILTEKIALLIPSEIKVLKLSKELPLIVEIPDRHGSIKQQDYIVRYVKESIGLKI